MLTVQLYAYECLHIIAHHSGEEWPKVASARFGTTPVNALRHWIEGLEYAPGKYADGNMIGLGSHSFTGQIATFLADYYDSCNVSINDIREDVTPVGSHNPSALMQSFTDESKFRFLGQCVTRPLQIPSTPSSLYETSLRIDQDVGVLTDPIALLYNNNVPLLSFAGTSVLVSESGTATSMSTVWISF